MTPASEAPGASLLLNAHHEPTAMPTTAPPTTRRRDGRAPLAALAAALTLLCAANPLRAQTATQTVSFEVQAINQLAVSGNPGALTISAATAGNAPTSVSNSSTTWALTTNETSRKVTASIDQAMPANVTLSVALGAPSGAASAGTKVLGTTAVDLVTGASTVNQGTLSITYTLAATAAAGVVPSGSRTVTFTLVAGP